MWPSGYRRSSLAGGAVPGPPRWKGGIMGRSFIPAKDADLLAWSVNFKTLITATPTDYGLTAGQATAYGTLHTAYATAYQTAIDPSTRTKPAITARRAARAALVADIRALAKIVEGTSTVTDAQKQ